MLYRPTSANDPQLRWPAPSETRLRPAINEAAPKPTSHSNTLFPQASSVFHGAALSERVQHFSNYGLQTLFFR